jgi:hypothetical protein
MSPSPINSCDAFLSFWTGSQARDAVEVRNERNGEPVVAGDLVISANDDTEFAGCARAQAIERCGADVIEIDRRVAGGIDAAEVAVGLLEQKRGGGHAVRRCQEEGAYKKRNEEELLCALVANVVLPRLNPWDASQCSLTSI